MRVVRRPAARVLELHAPRCSRCLPLGARRGEPQPSEISGRRSARSGPGTIHGPATAALLAMLASTRASRACRANGPPRSRQRRRRRVRAPHRSAHRRTRYPSFRSVQIGGWRRPATISLARTVSSSPTKPCSPRATRTSAKPHHTAAAITPSAPSRERAKNQRSTGPPPLQVLGAAQSGCAAGSPRSIPAFAARGSVAGRVAAHVSAPRVSSAADGLRPDQTSPSRGADSDHVQGGRAHSRPAVRTYPFRALAQPLPRARGGHTSEAAARLRADVLRRHRRALLAEGEGSRQVRATRRAWRGQGGDASSGRASRGGRGSRARCFDRYRRCWIPDWADLCGDASGRVPRRTRRVLHATNPRGSPSRSRRGGWRRLEARSRAGPRLRWRRLSWSRCATHGPASPRS